MTQSELFTVETPAAATSVILCCAIPAPPRRYGLKRQLNSGAHFTLPSSDSVETVPVAVTGDPPDGVMVDISPGAAGNNTLGTSDGHGHPVNPVTGQPYAPNLVKKTVVGAGHADKTQIQMMLKILLPKADPKSADAADALAIAITHAHHRVAAQRLKAVGA